MFLRKFCCNLEKMKIYRDCRWTLSHLNCFLGKNTDTYSIPHTGYWRPLSHDFVTNGWLVMMATYSAEHHTFIIELYVKQWEFLIWQHWLHTLGVHWNACLTFWIASGVHTKKKSVWKIIHSIGLLHRYFCLSWNVRR